MASYATGSVTGSGYGVGGLVGNNGYGGTISGSFATSSVTGAASMLADWSG
uniref:GLUG motif-containing protein n=1 Tax=Acidocella sp. C78 TaxID=1671486 RepID=UPI0035B308C3